MNLQTHHSGQISGQVPNQAGTMLPGFPQQNGNPVLSQMQNLSIHQGVLNTDLEYVKTRRYMQEKILNFLMQRRQQSHEVPEGKMFDLVKRLEEALFKSATTKDEYLNLATLENRLYVLIKRLPMNNHNQQFSHANSSPSIGTMIPTPGLQQAGNSSLIGTHSVDGSLVANNSSNTIASSAANSGNFLTTGNVSSGNVHGGSFSSPDGFVHEDSSVSWAQNPANSQNGASSTGTSSPARIEHRNMDVVLQNFNNFKKFDTVEDYSDHHYAKNGYSAEQPPKNWAKRIQEEWKILEKDLPDKIFVRVYESRMDLLRAVIIGAEGTPYHDGLFFFDVFFPGSYPKVPPHVHYHSGGLRINPNLYNCGKVCLSLLNTWSGSQKEKWIPGASTMLQVLVSIQGLILNAKPYFNEPGYANLSGSLDGEQRSLEYNESTFMHSLQTMVYSMRRPPKYFEDFVVGHFCKHARDILISCKAYLEGAQVGCLVKDGVQDVDEGNKSCSQQFKNNLAGFITVLVNTFTEIGAEDCQEFLSLAPKENAKPSALQGP